MKIKLQHDDNTASITLNEAIALRRSRRDFTDSPIALSDLSKLLWAAQGSSDISGKKTAPSAGAQYPLQIFAAVGAVNEITVGLYAYEEKTQSLCSMFDNDIRQGLQEAALEQQPWLGKAAAIIVLMADLGTVLANFHEQAPQGKRGFQYVHIETGAVAQNVHLQATALGLGMVLVGGFDDERVKQVLQLPARLEPTALLCIGHVS